MFRRTMSNIAVVAFIASAPLDAHHSAAMFDAGKTVELTGTVKVFEWTNPHAWIWIEVPRARGEAALWGGEFGGAINLARAGLTRHTMKPGDKLVLTLHPARDPKQTAGQVVRIVGGDGRQIYPTKKDD